MRTMEAIVLTATDVMETCSIVCQRGTACVDLWIWPLAIRFLWAPHMFVQMLPINSLMTFTKAMWIRLTTVWCGFALLWKYNSHSCVSHNLVLQMCNYKASEQARCFTTNPKEIAKPTGDVNHCRTVLPARPASRNFNLMKSSICVWGTGFEYDSAAKASK